MNAVDHYKKALKMRDPIWGYAIPSEYLCSLCQNRDRYIKLLKNKKSNNKKHAIRTLILIDLAIKERFGGIPPVFN